MCCVSNFCYINTQYEVFIVTTFRDLIIEALARSNIVPRKRTVPEDIFTDAARQLNGILADYSNRHYITAYRDEIDFNPLCEKMYVGLPDNYSQEAEYADDTIIVQGLQEPVSVLFKGNNSNAGMYQPMNFISYDQFYSMNNGIYTVSWTPVSARQWRVYFKPQFLSSNWTVKLIYNKQMEYADNDVINLPPQYIELLIRALAYKLSIQMPRTDTTKTSLLKSELDDIERMIEAANASQRIITRDSCRSSMMADFMSGKFILNG